MLRKPLGCQALCGFVALFVLGRAPCVLGGDRLPGDPAAAAMLRVGQAHALNKAGEFVAACRAFDEAARLLPEWWIARYERARCGRLLGERPELVLAHARAVSEYAPDRGVGWELLGLILEDAGEVDAALVAYEQALKRDAGLFDVHARLGRHALKGKRYAAARRHFEELRLLRNDSVLALAGIAEAAWGAEDWAAAEEALLALANRSNYPAEEYARLIRLYQKVSHPAGATAARRAWRRALEGGGVTPPLEPQLRP